MERRRKQAQNLEEADELIRSRATPEPEEHGNNYEDRGSAYSDGRKDD